MPWDLEVRLPALIETGSFHQPLLESWSSCKKWGWHYNLPSHFINIKTMHLMHRTWWLVSAHWCFYENELKKSEIKSKKTNKWTKTQLILYSTPRNLKSTKLLMVINIQIQGTESILLTSESLSGDQLCRCSINTCQSYSIISTNSTIISPSFHSISSFSP